MQHQCTPVNTMRGEGDRSPVHPAHSGGGGGGGGGGM